MERLKKQLIRQKYWQLWQEAQTDPEYAAQLVRMTQLEPRYEAAVKKLDVQDQDTVRDYVMQCEDMSRRMLELACQKLLFPK